MTLFRRIRRRFLAQNKFTRYLLYAIGEVVLVVIGILIALQVNNYNQQQQDRKQEELLLVSLHDEFIRNKAQFDSVVKVHHRSLRSAQFVMDQFPIDPVKADLDTLGYHLYYMGWVYTFNPSRGVTNSLVNTSSFGLITNDTLRELLIGWNDVVSDYQEEEIRARDNYVNHLKPFEKANFYYTSDYPMILGDPRVNKQVLTSLAFENYVLDRWSELNDIVNSAEREMQVVGEYIDRILELSEIDP